MIAARARSRTRLAGDVAGDRQTRQRVRQAEIRQRIDRVTLGGQLEVPDRLRQLRKRQPCHVKETAQILVVGVDAVRPGAFEAAWRLLTQSQFDRGRDRELTGRGEAICAVPAVLVRLRVR